MSGKPPKSSVLQKLQREGVKQCAVGSTVKVHKKKKERTNYLLQELKHIGKGKQNENIQVWKKRVWKYSSKFLICITGGKEFSLWRVKQGAKSSQLTKVIPTWQHSEVRMERILFFQIHPWFLQISLRLLKNFLEETEVYLLQPFAFCKRGSK